MNAEVTMKKLDIALSVKTFIRPDCLKRFLDSIVRYQNKWQVKFADVIVVDDGDEESQLVNSDLVKNYPDLHVSYYKYDFNSLGLCKGRNEGLAKCKAEYFICCDDDFMLDLDCDIEAAKQMLEDKNLDILGGYYRNISSEDAAKYQADNWIGFINSGDKEDFCSIYSSVFPEFVICDIVENFFIGRTEAVRKVGYPENVPIKEHNIVFLLFKQAGIKIGSTNKLFVRHYHIKKKKKNYNKFRNRMVVNPINKKVYGILVQQNKVFKFDDYLDVAKVKYVEDKKFIKHIDLGLIKISVRYKWLLRLPKEIKKGCKKLYNLIMKPWHKIKLEEYRRAYPRVMTTTETLKKLIEDKISIARFGDGEMKLVAGDGLGERGKKNEYQVFDAGLQKRLQEILKNPQPNVLVSIAPFSDKYDDTPNYKNGFSYMERFWIDYWNRVKDYFDFSFRYGCTTVTRSSVFYENKLEDVKKIWGGRKVLFVVGQNSHFIDEPRLFDNVAEKEFLYVKGKSSFDDYEKIFDQIKKYKTDWLIFISLGPTATLLACDLAKLGYQALDMGHLPNCYLQYLGEKESPEKENYK